MRQQKSFIMFLIVMLIGLVIGGVLGDIFKESLSILAYGKTIGFHPVTVDLSVIQFTIGFLMNINVASIIGIIIAIIIFKML